MGNTGDVRGELLSAEQFKKYSIGLKKVFMFQHRNGSWGRGNTTDKVIYTSQAIQLIQMLGISHDEKRFEKAESWLKHNLKRGDSHWATRIEIGLKVGEFQKLVDDKYIDYFLDDLTYDLEHPEEKSRLEFFWDVIPTLIALHPYEESYQSVANRTVPHEKVIEQIIARSKSFGDTITVQFQANHTGLAALYLATVNDKFQDSKIEEMISKMTKWILVKREETSDSVLWDDSRGIASYVLIDLLGCKKGSKDFQECIPKIVNSITPNSHGYVEKDSRTTTYGTKLHAESLYVTMLALRAMTEVLKMDDNNINKISESALKAFSFSWWEAILAKFHRFFYYNKKVMPIIICATVTILGIILCFMKQEFIGGSIITIGLSCAISYLFLWFNKD